MEQYVLVITMHADPAFPPGYDEWGGTHTYMHELLDCFTEHSIPCILVTRRSMEELPAIERYSNVCTVYRLENGEHTPMSKMLLRNYHERNLSLIKDIINVHGKPKAIHSVYWNSGRLAMELCNEFGVPLVHSVISNSRGRLSRGAALDDADRADFEQQIYERADVILCVSEDEKQDLVEHYRIDPDKLRVAGQFIHASYIEPSHDNCGFPRLNSAISQADLHLASELYNRLPESNVKNLFWVRKSFTYFGRISTSKGVDHVVAAWIRLFERYGCSCPPLWIAGGSLAEIDDMRMRLMRRFEKLDAYEASGKIIWWGCLDPQGISALLCKSLALVTNSLYEPGGRMVVEAMAEGVPVIASPYGFARDIIKDWQNGFLVDHGDEDLLLRRMEHFIRQPFIASALGENAKLSARKVIDEWSFFDSHLQAYGFPAHLSSTRLPDEKDWFRKRRANLYPCMYAPLSLSLVADLARSSHVQSESAQPLLASKFESTSDIYEFETHNLLAKRAYTRFTLSPLFNPAAKHSLLLSAHHSINTEINAYESDDREALIAFDREHSLLFVKKLPPFLIDNVDDLLVCIASIAENALVVDEEVERSFRRICHTHNAQTIADIENLLEELANRFPEYDFPPSCLFSTELSWMLAAHLINYNAHLIEPSLFKRLRKAEQYFSFASSNLPEPHLRQITLDVRADHAKMLDGALFFIDRERTSLGDLEAEVADLVLDFARSTGNIGSQMYWNEICNAIDERLNPERLLCAVAGRMIYQLAQDAVMETPQTFTAEDLSIIESSLMLLSTDHE